MFANVSKKVSSLGENDFPQSYHETAGQYLEIGQNHLFLSSYLSIIHNHLSYLILHCISATDTTSLNKL
jgi:hypothetical protein